MIKTLHHHAPGTLTAAKLGHGSTGCYTVETRESSRPMRIERAFDNHGEALEHFPSVPAIACKVWAKLNRPHARRGPAWLND